MATAAKKTAAPVRRPIAAAAAPAASPAPPAPSTTTLADSGAVVERTEGDEIKLVATAEDTETVTAIVPVEVRLTRDDGSEIIYRPGVQEMPLADAAHWFARARGVKVYGGTKAE